MILYQIIYMLATKRPGQHNLERSTITTKYQMQLRMKSSGEWNVLQSLFNNKIISYTGQSEIWTVATTKRCTLLENTVAPALQHVTKIHNKRSVKDKP